MKNLQKSDEIKINFLPKTKIRIGVIVGVWVRKSYFRRSFRLILFCNFDQKIRSPLFRASKVFLSEFDQVTKVLNGNLIRRSRVFKRLKCFYWPGCYSTLTSLCQNYFKPRDFQSLDFDLLKKRTFNLLIKDEKVSIIWKSGLSIFGNSTLRSFSQ